MLRIMQVDMDTARLAKWLRYIAMTWSDSAYFQKGVFDHPEISAWVEECSFASHQFSQEEISRTERVMRKLRRAAVREYEVLYRVLIVGQTFDQTSEWLNERARVNNIPLPDGRQEHYRRKDVVSIITSATEWCLDHW